MILKIQLFVTLILTLFVYCDAGSIDCDMKEQFKYNKIFSVKIKAFIENTDLFVDIEYKNISGKVAKMPYFYLFNKGIGHNAFEIIDEKNRVFEYCGRMVKRRMPRDEDFVVFSMGEKKTRRLKLNDSYRFHRDSSILKIRYYWWDELSSDFVKIKIPDGLILKSRAVVRQ